MVFTAVYEMCCIKMGIVQVSHKGCNPFFFPFLKIKRISNHNYNIFECCFFFFFVINGLSLNAQLSENVNELAIKTKVYIFIVLFFGLD